MTILLVEDDPKTALYVTEALQERAHQVHWAATGPDGLTQARRDGMRLVIIDRMLPVMDGLSLLKQLRTEGYRGPALFLTTMADVDDRVEGLEAGADDYITKPFALPEFLARVNALLRRARGPDETVIRIGGLELDLVARKVCREGAPIRLQHQEFALLRCLAEHAGEVVTRTMLLEKVWNLSFDPRSNIVESHMSRLRGKVDRGFACELIQTVRGAGYRLRA